MEWKNFHLHLQEPFLGPSSSIIPRIKMSWKVFSRKFVCRFFVSNSQSNFRKPEKPNFFSRFLKQKVPMIWKQKGGNICSYEIMEWKFPKNYKSLNMKDWILTWQFWIWIISILHRKFYYFFSSYENDRLLKLSDAIDFAVKFILLLPQRYGLKNLSA